jgi:hypothetical protein
MASPVSSIAPASHLCGDCNKPASQACGRCRQIFYCSVTCQKNNWASHKPSCKKKVITPQVASASVASAQAAIGISPAAPWLSEMAQCFKKNPLLLCNFEQAEAVISGIKIPEDPFLISIKSSPERRYMKLKYVLQIQESASGEVYPEDLGIEGIRKISRDPTPPPFNCALFAFSDESWYTPELDTAHLYESLHDVSQFLKQHGFTKTLTPQRGDIIVYFNLKKEDIGPKISPLYATHYGKVRNVDGEKNVTIRSKWGFKGDLWEHYSDYSNMDYGHWYLYLTKRATEHTEL